MSNFKFPWTCPTTDSIQDMIRETVQDEDMDIEERADLAADYLETLRDLFVDMRAAAEEQMENLAKDVKALEEEEDETQNELLARIAELEAENSELEAKVSTLEARVNELEDES